MTEIEPVDARTLIETIRRHIEQMTDYVKELEKLDLDLSYVVIRHELDKLLREAHQEGYREAVINHDRCRWEAVNYDPPICCCCGSVLDDEEEA